MFFSIVCYPINFTPFILGPKQGEVSVFRFFLLCVPQNLPVCQISAFKDQRMNSRIVMFQFVSQSQSVSDMHKEKDNLFDSLYESRAQQNKIISIRLLLLYALHSIPWLWLFLPLAQLFAFIKYFPIFIFLFNNYNYSQLYIWNSLCRVVCFPLISIRKIWLGVIASISIKRQRL